MDDSNSEDKFRLFGCLFLMSSFGALMIWMMGAGFAGGQRQFSVEFEFTSTGSSMSANFAPLERFMYNLAVFFLPSGVLFGLACNCKIASKKWKAASIFASTLLIGGFPIYGKALFPADAYVRASFYSPLSSALGMQMKDKLRLENVVAWRPKANQFAFAPPSIEELRSSGYRPEENDNFMFTGYFNFYAMSFKRRREIGEFYTAYLEEQGAAIAASAGLPPITKRSQQEFIEEF